MDAASRKEPSDAVAQGVISATDLTRSFGQTLAVDRLNLSIGRGEVFGLIGPDGSGKTTVLRMFAAVMRPTSGEVRVLGYSATRQAEKLRRRLGYMAQRFSLYTDLTVWENLNFYADIYGVRGAKRAVHLASLLEFSRLDEFRKRRTGALSGGMQKKLALACSLVHRPEIVLLDEPTTGVDPISRREFWDLLAGLHVQGVTIVVNTPYMDEAERCSRVGLIYQGRIIECDAPSALAARVSGEMLAVWTPQTALARACLANLPDVLSAQSYGDVVHVIVQDATRAEPVIRATLEERGVPVNEIRRAQPGIEDAFISLIRQRRTGEPAS
jgi:ABC-2 type transport system ATP-binding protein